MARSTAMRIVSCLIVHLVDGRRTRSVDDYGSVDLAQSQERPENVATMFPSDLASDSQGRSRATARRGLAESLACFLITSDHYTTSRIRGARNAIKSARSPFDRRFAAAIMNDETTKVGGQEGESTNVKMTEVGSTEYYNGFLRLRTPDEEKRGDGIEQNIKMAITASGVLAFLLLGFMANNGLL